VEAEGNEEMRQRSHFDVSGILETWKVRRRYNSRQTRIFRAVSLDPNNLDELTKPRSFGLQTLSGDLPIRLVEPGVV